ncbi:MAG: type IV secretory system conjugative DNA transfer family protein [Coriobacteriaceae bacterium]|nr:type IV secretory system conjugative DNA transfer family protein [Coriobacteriaceae bacterium]
MSDNAIKQNPVLALAIGGALAVPLGYVANRMAEGAITSIDPLEGALSAGELILSNPFHMSFADVPLIATLLAAIAPVCIALAWFSKNCGNRREGEEQGSARWATKKEIAPFATYKNPDPEFGKICLSENAGLAFSRTDFCLKYDRNLNVLVIGGSGCGKTRYYVKPNVLNMSSDIFVTDPKGDLLLDVGADLAAAGYNIRSFNTFLPDRSLVYNPLHYVKTDLDVLSFAKMFISMTTGSQKGGGDPFWEKAETMLYIALISFLRDYAPRTSYNIGGLLNLLSQAEVHENDENFQSPLDCLFNEIETGYRYEEVQGDDEAAACRGKENPVIVKDGSRKLVRYASRLRRSSDMKRPYDNVKEDGTRGFSVNQDFALENYKKFKTAAGKTLKSIIISCNVRLAPFTTAEVRGIVCGEDQMHLEQFGDGYGVLSSDEKAALAAGGKKAEEMRAALSEREKKNAVFCIFRDTDQQTLGFLHGIMVYQCINILCEKALREYGGRLPRPVNFILDEYRSLNLPKDISAMISVVRSRNIAMSIILQGLNQLGELYEEDTAKAIRSCCDTTLYLGMGKEDTCKFISETCGDQTIIDRNTSSSHGGSGGWSESRNKVKRPLIDPAEVAKLPKDECIVLIGGANPFRDKKYPLEKHPRYNPDPEPFDVVAAYDERRAVERELAEERKLARQRTLRYERSKRTAERKAAAEARAARQKKEGNTCDEGREKRGDAVGDTTGSTFAEASDTAHGRTRRHRPRGKKKGSAPKSEPL